MPNEHERRMIDIGEGVPILIVVSKDSTPPEITVNLTDQDEENWTAA